MNVQFIGCNRIETLLAYNSILGASTIVEFKEEDVDETDLAEYEMCAVFYN